MGDRAAKDAQFAELAAAAELPADHDVVASCRGQHSVMAHGAA